MIWSCFFFFLQNYQESLRESLEETQVDVETIDTDKDEMVVDQSVGTCVSMETENSPSVSGVTSVTGVTSVMSVTGVTSRTVTVQNASVQTDDDKHSGLISNCSRSKDQIGSSRFVNDEPTTSSCSVSHGKWKFLIMDLHYKERNCTGCPLSIHPQLSFQMINQKNVDSLVMPGLLSNAGILYDLA